MIKIRNIIVVMVRGSRLPLKEMSFALFDDDMMVSLSDGMVMIIIM